MEKDCPIYKEPCHEHRCKWYVPLTVNTPTVPPVSEVQWDCAINWNIFLLIENAKQMRGVAASSDKVANEINAAAGTILLRAMGVPLLLEHKG